MLARVGLAAALFASADAAWRTECADPYRSNSVIINASQVVSSTIIALYAHFGSVLPHLSRMAAVVAVDVQQRALTATNARRFYASRLLRRAQCQAHTHYFSRYRRKLRKLCEARGAVGRLAYLPVAYSAADLRLLASLPAAASLSPRALQVKSKHAYAYQADLGTGNYSRSQWRVHSMPTVTPAGIVLVADVECRIMAFAPPETLPYSINTQKWNPLWVWEVRAPPPRHTATPVRTARIRVWPVAHPLLLPVALCPVSPSRRAH